MSLKMDDFIQCTPKAYYQLLTKELRAENNKISKAFVLPIVLTLALVSLAQDDHAHFTTFRTCWSLYVNGDYSEAKDLIDTVPVSSLSSVLLQANFKYLEGLLANIEGRDNAIALLEEAKSLYQEENNLRGTRNVDFVLAGKYLQEESFGKAQEIIDGFTETSGHVLYMKARLAFHQKDYPAALLHGQQSLEEFQRSGDKTRASQLKVSVGLYQMLIGDLQKGFLTTLEGQAGIAKKGRAGQYYFSLVNMVIFQRCKSGSGATEVIKTIQKRLEKEPDEDLRKMLDFAIHYNCGQ